MTYPNPSNTSLLQCCHCPNLADVLQTMTFQHVLVDLMLLKPRVYRHLLVNRKSRKPKTNKDDVVEGVASIQDERDRVGVADDDEWSTNSFVIGTIVTVLDAYIRCANDWSNGDSPFEAYTAALAMSLFETLTWHTSVLVVASLSQYIPPRSRSKPLCSLRLLPLTLFYSSIPTLFMLSVSSLVWPNEYRKKSMSAATTTTTMTITEADSFDSMQDLTRIVSHLIAKVVGSSSFATSLVPLLDTFNTSSSKSMSSDSWANEFLLRNVVGGLSAIVGVSALMNASTLRTCLILACASALKACCCRAL
ncbi:hypothetical protein ACM66B_006592 [Microbotryomycetes sp. NB124-2]